MEGDSITITMSGFSTFHFGSSELESTVHLRQFFVTVWRSFKLVDIFLDNISVRESRNISFTSDSISLLENLSWSEDKRSVSAKPK